MKPIQPTTQTTLTTDDRRRAAEKFKRLRPMIDNTDHGKFQKMLKEKMKDASGRR